MLQTTHKIKTWNSDGTNNEMCVFGKEKENIDVKE